MRCERHSRDGLGDGGRRVVGRRRRERGQRRRGDCDRLSASKEVRKLVASLLFFFLPAFVDFSHYQGPNLRVASDSVLFIFDMTQAFAHCYPSARRNPAVRFVLGIENTVQPVV